MIYRNLDLGDKVLLWSLVIAACILRTCAGVLLAGAMR